MAASGRAVWSPEATDVSVGSAPAIPAAPGSVTVEAPVKVACAIQQVGEPLSFHVPANADDPLRHCLEDGHELTPYESPGGCGDCPVCGGHWYRRRRRGDWLVTSMPEGCPAHTPKEFSEPARRPLKEPLQAKVASRWLAMRTRG